MKSHLAMAIDFLSGLDYELAILLFLIVQSSKIYVKSIFSTSTLHPPYLIKNIDCDCWLAISTLFFIYEVITCLVSSKQS